MAQFDVNTLVFTIQAQTCDVFEFFASDTGGAVTLLEAQATNNADTSGNTSFGVAVKKWTNGTTPQLAGTVFAPVGGTNDHWVKGRPKPMTLANSLAVVEAGEWLSLCMTQQNNGTPTFGRVVIHYVGGKV